MNFPFLIAPLLEIFSLTLPYLAIISAHNWSLPEAPRRPNFSAFYYLELLVSSFKTKELPIQAQLSVYSKMDFKGTASQQILIAHLLPISCIVFLHFIQPMVYLGFCLLFVFPSKPNSQNVKNTILTHKWAHQSFI